MNHNNKTMMKYDQNLDDEDEIIDKSRHARVE